MLLLLPPVGCVLQGQLPLPGLVPPQLLYLRHKGRVSLIAALLLLLLLLLVVLARRLKDANGVAQSQYFSAIAVAAADEAVMMLREVQDAAADEDENPS